jgi:hypothetical protein
MRNLKTLNEEINRMKSLFNYKKGTSNVDDLIIYEQENPPGGVIVDENKGKECIDILHTGTFAAEKSDSSKPFKEFIAKMQSEINSNEKLKKQIEEGGKVFITELKIMGGASNHYNKKATAADVENDYTTPYSGDIEKDSGYEANVGYAKSRAENLLNAMVSKLPEMSIKLKDGLLEDAKNNIVTKVINTGGKNDSGRPKATHKNPGQIVKIEMKICSEKTVEPEVLECFESATIRVDYDSNSRDQTHNCNFAVYEIYANGVKLERADGKEYASLNNSTREDTDYKPQGYLSGRNQSKEPAPYVYNEFKLTMDGVNKLFFNQENIYKYDGGLVVSAKCMDTNNGKKWGKDSDCHKWVGDIKLSTTEGAEVVNVGKSDLPNTGLQFSTPNSYGGKPVPVAGFEACKNLATK